MYEATATPEIRAALQKGRQARACAFLSLFRRTRPSRARKARGCDLAAV